MRRRNPTPFKGDDAVAVVDKLPVGSVIVLYIPDHKGKIRRRYYAVSTKGGLRAVRHMKYGAVESASKAAQSAKKGIVLHVGKDLPVSWSIAAKIADKHKGGHVSKPSYGSAPTPLSGKSGKSSKSYKPKKHPWTSSGTTTSGGQVWDETKGKWTTPSVSDDWASDFAGGGWGPPPPPPKPKVAAGGVVIRNDGKILLRMPKNYFSNVAWSHGKGGVDAGETIEEGAVREVLEETGWRVAVVAPIPGEYKGMTSVNHYFLMRPLGEDLTPSPPNYAKQGPIPGRMYPESETYKVAWFTPAEARARIMDTQNTSTRLRDLKVLEEGLKLWKAMKRKKPTRKAARKASRSNPDMAARYYARRLY